MRAAKLLLAMCAVAMGQDDVYEIGPRVKSPTIISKVDPSYSPEGLKALIQGTCVIEIVVNEQGRTSEISVVSPLGFGLDEAAQSAIERWRFNPGTMDGKPVKVRAIIEVNFRLSGQSYDHKAEERRSDYNVAASHLTGSDPKLRQRGIETIQKLSKQQYPPAMFSEAKLIENGLIPPADPARVLAL